MRRIATGRPICFEIPVAVLAQPRSMERVLSLAAQLGPVAAHLLDEAVRVGG
jgi:hypothetical protein